ncbi:MAG: hypothetical protein ACI4OL_00250 [Gemmiger sp.]
MTHEIALRDYRAVPADGCDALRLGTRDSYGIERLHLVPDGSWEGLAITAVFHAPDGTATQMLADGGTVEVPPEATAAPGEGRIVFAGTAQGRQRVSSDLVYRVRDHAPAEGAEPAGPAPSWYEQATAHFLPVGGTAGQVLVKRTNADLDVEWDDSSNTGGVNDHDRLRNRDLADQHPISAITGLETALDAKQPAGSYLTQESDPTVPDWAKQPAKPAYTADEVGADAAGTAQSRVAAHNTVADAHADIRLLIQQLADRLNALADSDDTTLDQLSEIVAYIKSNRDLISAVTTDKVSVADIIDNLTTNVAGKPLSAAQGVALKALIDAITVPTALPNPNALTFRGALTGSYDGSKAVDVEIYPGSYPVVEMTAAAAQLLPNTCYRWGEITALTVTLGAEIAGITNEYCFEFSSGSTPTTLTVPDTVKWVREPDIEADKTYQVSILNGIGVIAGA